MGLRDLFKKKPVEEPADVHPAQRKKINVPVTPPTEKPAAAPVPVAAQTIDASGLTREEIDQVRELAFKEIGIPYDMVKNAEAKGAIKVSPDKLVRELAEVNHELERHRLIKPGFKINAYELFVCELHLIDHEAKRLSQRKALQPVDPPVNLLQIVILRFAERYIRQQKGMAEDQAVPGSESLELYNKIWQKAKDDQIYFQARAQLLRSKDQPITEDELTEDMIKERVKQIKADRHARSTSIRFLRPT